MGSHPINLALRFFLELAALVALALWGWRQPEGIWKYALAIGLPLIAAVIWGTFAVPGDPSRSGKAPVSVPGIIRLILELIIFGSGTWSLFDLGYKEISFVMGLVVLLHYAVSYDRINWLFNAR